MNLEIQKELLKQNYQAVDVIKDGITKKLLKSEPYIIGDYYGKMGCKFIKESNQKHYIQKTDLRGIYHVQVKFNDQYIDLYTGESEACIGTRIARLIKQASGDNRDDETHSAGELLYNKFSKYGRQDLWLHNLRVRFLQIRDIFDMLGLTSFPYHNLFDKEYLTLVDTDLKLLLQTLEQGVIDRLAPIGNRQAQRMMDQKRFSNNIKLFEELCQMVNTQTPNNLKVKELQH